MLVDRVRDILIVEFVIYLCILGTRVILFRWQGSRSVDTGDRVRDIRMIKTEHINDVVGDTDSYQYVLICETQLFF